YRISGYPVFWTLRVTLRVVKSIVWIIVSDFFREKFTVLKIGLVDLFGRLSMPVTRNMSGKLENAEEYLRVNLSSPQVSSLPVSLSVFDNFKHTPHVSPGFDNIAMGGSVVVDSDVDSDVATELEILELKVQELRLRSKQRKLKSERSQQVKTAASCVRSCANPSESQLLDGSTMYCTAQPSGSNCTATPVQPLLNSVSPIRMPQIEMDKFDGTPTKF
uniref:Uncharacterized protein n=1 Tax=Trichobilharzia regenti TaxID=157069 RepID=A0AA85K6W3_TRIRE